MSSLNTPKYAWCLAIWGKPQYLVGAIATAHSLREVKTKHDIVLLYNKLDLTPFSLKSTKLFDLIQEVPLLEIQAVPMPSKRQNQLYKGFFSTTVCTKWQCLRLTQYNKVMFSDSDAIFRRNADHLFSLPAPAGCFNNPFAQSWIPKRGIFDSYGRLKHSEPVPRKAIQDGLEKGTVVGGFLVLLEPSLENLQQYTKWIQEHKPYGHPNCHSVVDEQSITEFYSEIKKITWTNIDQLYYAIPWKCHWCPGKDILREAYALHYYHDKPFEKGEAVGWPDTMIFWALWGRFQKQYPALEKSLRSLMGHYEIAPTPSAPLLEIQEADPVYYQEVTKYLQTLVRIFRNEFKHGILLELGGGYGDTLITYVRAQLREVYFMEGNHFALQEAKGRFQKSCSPPVHFIQGDIFNSTFLQKILHGVTIQGIYLSETTLGNAFETPEKLKGLLDMVNNINRKRNSKDGHSAIIVGCYYCGTHPKIIASEKTEGFGNRIQLSIPCASELTPTYKVEVNILKQAFEKVGYEYQEVRSSNSDIPLYIHFMAKPIHNRKS
jgi:hypothetical protein